MQREKNLLILWIKNEGIRKMNEERKSLYALSLTEMQELIVTLGEKKFRAKQIYEDIVSMRCLNIDEMKRLPQDFRNKLKEKYTVFTMSVVDHRADKERNTVKYLLKTDDNYGIEVVLLKYKHGYTLCISTQVGCRMGCDFCASTIGGKKRDLLPDEMIQQIALISKSEDVRISNVVLMGIGEPLDNYDNVLKFLYLVTNENHFNISMRKITVSTCGIVPRIYQLADEKLQITLAVSLHQTINEKRSAIMPVNRAYNIQKLNEAIDYYIEKTSRRVSIEYALIKGVNDTREEAENLVSMYKGKLVHINLIPLNTVKEKSHRASTKKSIDNFVDYLTKNGINATVRREMGGSEDIAGACGQLVISNQ